MKQAKAEKPPKKSLYDLCQERKHELHDAKREKDEAAKAALFRQQEDEIMAMTYGPNWRSKRLPGDPEPPKAKVAPVKPVFDEEYEDESYDDIPDAEDSRVRLRAG